MIPWQSKGHRFDSDILHNNRGIQNGCLCCFSSSRLISGGQGITKGRDGHRFDSGNLHSLSHKVELFAPFFFLTFPYSLKSLRF